MTMIYSNPARENEPYALPDVEVFYVATVAQCHRCTNGDGETRDYHNREHAGWYWRRYLQGNLPDGKPNGPFATEAEAIADAQSDAITADDISDAAAEYIGTAFGGPQGGEEHEHVYGPIEESRMAGTQHRKCQVPGCQFVSLDLDDDEGNDAECAS